MSKFVKANEATATKRRCFFHLVDVTDGITPETGEASGQPQVSTNGGAFTNTGIGTLTHLGNGRYYADLTQALVATAGDQIETRFKSANTAECPGDSFQVVAFDPYDIVRMGLTAIPNVAQGNAGQLPTATSAGLVTLAGVTHTGAVIPTVSAVSGAVGSVTGAVGSVTGNVSGSVASVVGNVGGNVTGSVGSVVGAVGSVTGNVGGNVTGSVGSVVGAVGSVTGAVGSVTGNVGGNVTGTVGSVVGAVGSVTGNVGGNVAGSVASVTGNVGGNVVGSVASVTVVSDKTGYSLATAPPTAAENATAVLTTAMAEAYAADGANATVAQLLYMLWSAVGDFSISGTTLTTKKQDGTDAMVFTLDDATSPTSRTRSS